MRSFKVALLGGIAFLISCTVPQIAFTGHVSLDQPSEVRSAMKNCRACHPEQAKVVVAARAAITSAELERQPTPLIQRLHLIQPAMADEPAVPAPSGPSGAQRVGSTLENIADKIPLEGVVITLALFVYDFVRRKWPTKNPASLWRDVKAVIKGAIALLSKLDQLGDRIFGQSTK